MGYRIRIPSKSIPTDEAHLLSGLERFLLSLQEHRQWVLGGSVVLLAAVAVVAAVIWLDHRNMEQAQDLNRQATFLYLYRPADNPVKADENLRKAIALYHQIVEQYPRTTIAPMALYHLANAQVQANDLGGAIESYRKYSELYGASKTMLGLVYQRLGYVYLLRGERDQAVKAFESVLVVPGALNKDQALYELAKLEEADSHPEAAVARYQELMKAYPNSPFAGEATVRAKALELKQSPDAQPASPPAAAPTPSGQGKQ